MGPKKRGEQLVFWPLMCTVCGIWFAAGVPWHTVTLLYLPSFIFSIVATKCTSVPSVLCFMLQLPILLAPWGVADPVLKAVFAFCGIFVLARALQLLSRRRWYSTHSWRLAFCHMDWFVMRSAHSEQLNLAPPPPGTFLSHLRTYVISAACVLFVVIFRIRLLPLNRWADAALCGIASAAALCNLDSFFCGYWALQGVHVRKMMNRPEFAVSLKDFWSNRWDMMMREILVDIVYSPLRSLGVGRSAAAVGVFLASGFIHAYPLIVTSVPAAGAVLFFIFQAILLEVEKRLGLGASRSGTSAGILVLHRLWVALSLMLPLPLLMSPFLRISAA